MHVQTGKMPYTENKMKNKLIAKFKRSGHWTTIKCVGGACHRSLPFSQKWDVLRKDKEVTGPVLSFLPAASPGTPQASVVEADCGGRCPRLVHALVFLRGWGHDLSESLCLLRNCINAGHV